MAGVSESRPALPPPPRVAAVELVAAVLAAREPLDRESVVALRTATADEVELRRLLVFTSSVAAWAVHALASCRTKAAGRRVRPESIVQELRGEVSGS